MRWRRILGVAVMVAVLGVGTVFWRSERHRVSLELDFEGKSGVRALCLAVKEFHDAHGAWVSAPLTPVTIPSPSGVAFPTSVREYAQLGFSPGLVHFQYEVRETQEGRECIARGDPDADGIESVFRAIVP
jgi:hypothetical protein